MKPTMAEVYFRIACIERVLLISEFELYSRSTVDEVSYYHGKFETTEEMLYSIAQRCGEIRIRFVEPYAKRLLDDYTFTK